MMIIILNKYILLLYLCLLDLASSDYEVEYHKNDDYYSDNEKRNLFSSPKECIRECYEGVEPKICYYNFVVERYVTQGGACDLCHPKKSNVYDNNCECIVADGYQRSVTTVNRMLPGPKIEVCENDTIVVDVKNKIDGESLTIHWHGVLQMNTQIYDGVPFVTQCPINEGETFRYQFKGSDTGTFFYHTHVGWQVNEITGALIVKKKKDDNSNLYDFDKNIIILQDFYHEYLVERIPGLNFTWPGQAPENILINGIGIFNGETNVPNVKFTMEKFVIQQNKRYRFRLINAFASVCPCSVTFESHRMTIIESDGAPVEPFEVDSLQSTTGERYDFVLNANQAPGTYWVQVIGLGECSNIIQLALLQYETPKNSRDSTNEKRRVTKVLPTAENPLPAGVTLNPSVDFANSDNEDFVFLTQIRNELDVDKRISSTPNKQFVLPFGFYAFTNPQELYDSNSDKFLGQNYSLFFMPEGSPPLISFIDNISYESPPSPLISQYKDNNPEIYCNNNKKPKKCENQAICSCTHIIQVDYMDLVEIVLLQGASTLTHPFHLHGYQFYVVGMGVGEEYNITNFNKDSFNELDKAGKIKRQFDRPISKDTVTVPINGYVIIRFEADNLGFWLLHCHFIAHMSTGMVLVVQVGGTDQFPTIHKNFPKCGDFLPDIYIDDYDMPYYYQKIPHH